jgi:hypothetical protein
MMGEMRQSHRQPIVVERNCPMGVISFKRFEWEDHVVNLVDMSSTGVGIVSRQSIEPGFVWFRDRVAGHKGGVVIWIRQSGEKFRAGIRLLPLSPESEQYIQKECGGQLHHKPLREPEAIIATLMESLERIERSRSIEELNLSEETEQ